ADYSHYRLLSTTIEDYALCRSACRTQLAHGYRVSTFDSAEPGHPGRRQITTNDCRASLRYLSHRRLFMDIQLSAPALYRAFCRQCGTELATGCLWSHRRPRYVVL